MTAAFFFHPDAYVIDNRELVGRRAAGAAFLRAAVEGRGGDPLIAYTGSNQDHILFERAIRAIDPTAPTERIALNRLDRLEKIGTLYRPDPSLAVHARLRLRSNPAAYSLCGVTHTLSSARALEVMAGFVTEPIMPWDAVICTSTAALNVVEAVIDASIDLYRWRMRLTGRPEMPQFPIIPLGVHCADLATSDADRHAARTSLALAEDEVAVLFAGRLSLSTKAHPFQMYDALRVVAEKTGKRLVLVQAGQFFNEESAKVIRGATAEFAHGVRAIFVNGSDNALYAAAFAGADLFVSLSDSIQETFGLTPIEAMAAGLPVIVSDWNGYRDTVRDGIDGFRIATRAPMAGAGHRISVAYEMDKQYELFTARASATTSMDMAQLVNRLTLLISDGAMRRRMGDAGRQRALADYDWSVIYRRYRALWDELGDRRRHAVASKHALLSGAPKAHPAHEDPYRIFAKYPTKAITGDTMVRAAPDASIARYRQLTSQPIFELEPFPLELADLLITSITAAPLPVAKLVGLLKQDAGTVCRMVAQLTKMNLLILEG